MKTHYPGLAFILVLLFTLFTQCKPVEKKEEPATRIPVIQSEDVRYSVDGMQFRGWIAWDSTIHEKRPGIIIIHEWWGHNDYARARAKMLAEMGYTAFAIDMFGAGKQAAHPDSAMAFVQQALTTAGGARPKFEKALEILNAHRTVQSGQIAALGYCFGGTVALEMARAGLDLDGVVSFHGGLGTENPAQSGVLKSAILVCTGSADPMIPEEQVRSFEAEMTAAGASFRVIRHPDAMHSFTNPAADRFGKQFDMPLRYDARADSVSWQATGEFLSSLFGS